MKAAFIIFDRMTYLDFIGFYDAVTRLDSMKILDGFDDPVPRPEEESGQEDEPGSETHG
jgi:hypothetical protein